MKPTMIDSKGRLFNVSFPGLVALGTVVNISQKGNTPLSLSQKNAHHFSPKLNFLEKKHLLHLQQKFHYPSLRCLFCSFDHFHIHKFGVFAHHPHLFQNRIKEFSSFATPRSKELAKNLASFTTFFHM